jgi:hypothetical protein
MHYDLRDERVKRGVGAVSNVTSAINAQLKRRRGRECGGMRWRRRRWWWRRRWRQQVITPGPDGKSNADMQPLEAATEIVRGSMTRSRDMRA